MYGEKRYIFVKNIIHSHVNCMGCEINKDTFMIKIEVSVPYLEKLLKEEKIDEIRNYFIKLLEEEFDKRNELNNADKMNSNCKKCMRESYSF